jgi:hypothetical protein
MLPDLTVAHAVNRRCWTSRLVTREGERLEWYDGQSPRPRQALQHAGVRRRIAPAGATALVTAGTAPAARGPPNAGTSRGGASGRCPRNRARRADRVRPDDLAGARHWTSSAPTPPLWGNAAGGVREHLLRGTRPRFTVDFGVLQLRVWRLPRQLDISLEWRAWPPGPTPSDGWRAHS